MRQYQLRATVRGRSQRHGSHRENAFGEAPMAPGLNDSSSLDEINVHARDIVPIGGEHPADLVPDFRHSACHLGALLRVCEEIVNDGWRGLELHPLLDGLHIVASFATQTGWLVIESSIYPGGRSHPLLQGRPDEGKLANSPRHLFRWRPDRHFRLRPI